MRSLTRLLCAFALLLSVAFAQSLDETRKKAESGDADAQVSLGHEYRYGFSGLPSDVSEAIKWYRAAAEQGDAYGQYNLGAVYANGEGMPKDDAEAVKWWRMAADQGLANAQYNLGFMYADGRGVPKDDAEAVKWYRAAAATGHAGSRFHLGAAYATGEGVREDLIQAHLWLNLAGATDDKTYSTSAKTALAEVEKKMNAEQKVEATKLAREMFERERIERLAAVERELAERLAVAQAQEKKDAAARAAAEKIRPDVPPRSTFQVEPAYPSESRSAGSTGWVDVAFTVDVRGKVINVRAEGDPKAPAILAVVEKELTVEQRGEAMAMATAAFALKKERESRLRLQVLKNLQEIASTANFYFFENPDAVYVPVSRLQAASGLFLLPVDGEDYGALVFYREGQTLRIITKSGLEVEYSATSNSAPSTSLVRPAFLSERVDETSNLNVIAHNALRREYGAYLARIIDAVNTQWDKNIRAKLEGGFSYPLAESKVRVTFRLNKEGDVSILNVDGSADTVWSRVPVDAVAQRAPYGVWSDDMIANMGNSTDITFTFSYP
jgi:TPR repeat protein